MPDLSRTVRHVSVAVSTALLLLGCSAESEDPRVSLCRNLAADLSGTQATDWKGSGNRFVRPSYAVVNVTSSGEAAACSYAYEAVEEGAMEHANPLLAYATLPYEMTLNGTLVAAPTLKAAVMRQQKAIPAKAIEETRKAVEQASEHIRQTIDSVNNR